MTIYNITYSNTPPVTVHANSYVTDGVRTEFALPANASTTSKSEINLYINGTLQMPADWVYPSSNLGYNGINITLAPSNTEVVYIQVDTEADDVALANTSMLVTLDEYKQYIEDYTVDETKDARISNIIIIASKLVENYCGRGFTAANVTEYFDGGQLAIFPTRLPINQIHVVAEYDGTSFANLTGGTLGTAQYIYYQDIGKISAYNRAFYAYPQGVAVTYNGGYSSIPADLRGAVMEITKSIAKGINDQEVSMQGDQIIQFQPKGGFSPHIRRVLDLYRLLA